MPKLKTIKPMLRTIKPVIAMAPRDQRRDAEQPWRKWYKTRRWQAVRARVLQRDHYTCKCGVVDVKKYGLHCDHVTPHRGDERLFWDESNMQTLCAHCHNSLKQREEAHARIR